MKRNYLTSENWGKRHRLDWRAMAADYKRGMTLNEIAEKVGMSYDRVRNVFIEHKIPRRPVGGANALAKLRAEIARLQYELTRRAEK
jgi:predicted transcriptional regulator